MPDSPQPPAAPQDNSAASSDSAMDHATMSASQQSDKATASPHQAGAHAQTGHRQGAITGHDDDPQVEKDTRPEADRREEGDVLTEADLRGEGDVLTKADPWAGDGQWTARAIQALVDPTKTPTDEQVAVIEGPLQPTLVVAGAGSGKTETMSMRVLWLVSHEGISPERILGLTFTRKAAGELGERLRARLAVLADAIPQIAECESPTVATYNSFAQRIVKEHGWRLGVGPEVRLIGSAATVQLLTDIVRERDTSELPDLALSTIVADCHALSQKIAEHGLTLESAREQFADISAHIHHVGAKKETLYADARAMLSVMERREQYLSIIAEFARRKQQLGVIDFADQLALATRLVTEFPAVVDAVRSEFDAVLLDEFQDTSVIQMQLFSRIFGSHAGKRLAVTAVGDPNQAIYGWRGASSASLEDFISAFDMDLDTPVLTHEEQREKSLSQTLTLSTAWRNDKQILFAANVLAAPLAGVSERVIVKPLRARPGAGVGEVHCTYLATPNQEADHVAEHMHRILTDWQAACDEARSARRTPPACPSMAVLAKRRKDFDRFNQALTARGIPTQVFDSGGLLEHPTIQRLVAALRVSTNVGDATSLIYLIDKLRLGASDMVLLWAWANEQATDSHNTRYAANSFATATLLMEAIDSPPPVGWQADPEGPAFTQAAHERVSTLGSRLRALRASAAHGIEEYVERAIAVMGLVQDSLADHVIRDGRDMLDAFMDIVIEYATGNEWADIPGFLTWLDIAAEEERGLPTPATDPVEGAVHIMTVHGSKGLEWDVVAVVGMSDGAFPQHRSTSQLRDIVSHPGYCSVSEQALWPEKGWTSQAKELPYEMRGDRSVLPPFDAEDYINDPSDNWTFPKWYKHVFRPSVGRHQEREQRRLAYVAATRARNTLLLTGNWLDTATGRAPSIYLLEVLSSLKMRAGEEHAVDAPTPQLRDHWDESWMACIPYEQRQLMRQRWSDQLDEWAQRDECVAKARECRATEDESKAPVYYPVPSTPTQELIDEAAVAIAALASEFPDRADIPSVLERLGEDPMIRHALAVIAEHRRQAQDETHTIELGTLSATSVASLVSDRDAFALHLRRPLPPRPSSSASLGTLIHAWVERQLRQHTGELWADPVEGIELLTTSEKKRFAAMQNTFDELTLPGTITALEELFAVTVHGITIQGRIDAVFTHNNRDIIVDWKSGRFPSPTDIPTLRYFRDQLELYCQAWAARTNTSRDHVDAQLIFLESGKILPLDTINEWIREAGNDETLSQQLYAALSIDDLA